MLVLLSTDDADEPRFQIRGGVKSQQVFGVDTEGLAPGAEAAIDGDTFGYPVTSLADVPPGDYTVQALLHKYETFTRADGHTVQLPMDRGEGQRWNRARRLRRAANSRGSFPSWATIPNVAFDESCRPRLEQGLL